MEWNQGSKNMCDIASAYEGLTLLEENIDHYNKNQFSKYL